MTVTIKKFQGKKEWMKKEINSDIVKWKLFTFYLSLHFLATKSKITKSHKSHKIKFLRSLCLRRQHMSCCLLFVNCDVKKEILFCWKFPPSHTHSLSTLMTDYICCWKIQDKPLKLTLTFPRHVLRVFFSFFTFDRRKKHREWIHIE